jgi:hypothetical protein
MTLKRVVAAPGGTALTPNLSVVDDDDGAAVVAAQATADAALDAALGAYAAVAIRTEYVSASVVNVENHRGHSNLIALKLDGIVYTAVGPLPIDLTVAGRGGVLDGVEQVSTWYYVYGVPGLVGTDLAVGVSSRPPSLGPLGYAEWRYIGAVYNNAAGNIRPFKQVTGERFVYLEYADSYNSGGPVGADANLVDFDLSAFVPYTAGECSIFAEVQVQAVGTQYEWNFYVDPALNEYNHVEGDPTAASTAINTMAIPIVTPQHIWRQLVRTVGAANAQYVYCGVLGWEDEWI